ncbi:MAG TPA: malonate decarboxylase holo-[acyl-carrier-protein] synthase [Acetobacteraceae bacterium]|nr:malonate decarboxylase holo-[acyl-carrier-protein] synthase [Acetobacteraceae bacterium]
MAEVLRRHAMVNPSPPAWAALMALRSDLAEEPLVAGWAQARYPLVVRRPGCGDAAGTVPLGLPLPPAHGKRRIAVTLEPEEIVHAGPPPLLAEAATVAPPGWRDGIDRLLHLDPLTRTFGSLAWQHLTGLPYLSEGSDLDLLWRLPSEADVGALLAGIAAIARETPMRIDGEVVGAAGGVQWRELQGDDAGAILVKGSRDVRMMQRADFLAGGAG